MALMSNALLKQLVIPFAELCVLQSDTYISKVLNYTKMRWGRKHRLSLLLKDVNVCLGQFGAKNVQKSHDENLVNNNTTIYLL